MNIDGTYHQIFICWSEKVDVSWGHFHLLDRYIRRIDALLPEDMEDLVRPMSYKPNQEQTTRSRCQMSSDVIRCHQMSSDVIRCHQMSSDVIRCHQMSSDVTFFYATTISLISIPARRWSSLPGASRLPFQMPWWRQLTSARRKWETSWHQLCQDPLRWDGHQRKAKQMMNFALIPSGHWTQLWKITTFNGDLSSIDGPFPLLLVC